MKPAAILTATGATILTAYVFRHQIAAAVLGFLGLRMIYGAAKAKLGIRHRSRTSGLESGSITPLREAEIASDNTDDDDAPHVPNTEWKMMLDAGEKR